MSSLSDQYLLLKDAFVATNAKSAHQAANAFLQELEKVNMTLDKGEAHQYWMKQLTSFQGPGKK